MYDLLPEAEQDVVDSIDYQAPNGESWMDVADRAVEFFGDLETGEEDSAAYLVFTHGGLICSLSHDLGFEDMLTCGSVMGMDVDLDGNPEDIVFDWEFPLEEI
jgi:broad specificity phosphatase PhoE